MEHVLKLLDYINPDDIGQGTLVFGHSGRFVFSQAEAVVWCVYSGVVCIHRFM